MFDRIKRPIEGYNKIWLGSIAIGAIVAVVGAILLTGNLSLGHTRYRADFAQAAGIRPGEHVTVAGISVGTVTSQQLAGDHVVVEFAVRNDVHVGADSTAAIKLTTILGSRYIELKPAGTDNLDNRTIPLSNTSVPYDLQKTLMNATTTFDPVDADRIAESLGALSQGLDGLPDALPRALENFRSLSAIISGRRDQIGSLLTSVDTLTTMIRDQQANLGSLMVQGRDLLAEIVSRRAAMEQLLASATGLVHTIDAILEDEPEIDELLADVRDLTRILADKDALLRNMFQAMPPAIRNWANATGSGTAIDINAPAGFLFDSWMCAISGRAEQFGLPEYLQDCK